MRATYEHFVEEIEVVHGGEGFALFFGGCGEVGFCVGGCDYGERTAEGGLDFGVEMVAVGGKELGELLVLSWGGCGKGCGMEWG